MRVPANQDFNAVGTLQTTSHTRQPGEQISYPATGWKKIHIRQPGEAHKNWKIDTDMSPTLQKYEFVHSKRAFAA